MPMGGMVPGAVPAAAPAPEVSLGHRKTEFSVPG